MSTKDRTSVLRNLKVGESLTLDNGRIVIEMVERTGRNSARIRLDLDADVVVNKPKVSSPAAFARMGMVPAT